MLILFHCETSLVLFTLSWMSFRIIVRNIASRSPNFSLNSLATNLAFTFRSVSGRTESNACLIYLFVKPSCRALTALKCDDHLLSALCHNICICRNKCPISCQPNTWAKYNLFPWKWYQNFPSMSKSRDKGIQMLKITNCIIGMFSALNPNTNKVTNIGYNIV